MTHGIHWLPEVDYIVVMNNGMISETGTYQELVNLNGPFADFLNNYHIENDRDELSDYEECMSAFT